MTFRTYKWNLILSILSGVIAGILIGSCSSGMFHWDRITGPISAGIVVALFSACISNERIIIRAVIAGGFVAISCMFTIIFRHWFTGHWALWHIDGKALIIFIALLFYICLPGLLISFIVSVINRKKLPNKKDTLNSDSAVAKPE